MSELGGNISLTRITDTVDVLERCDMGACDVLERCDMGMCDVVERCDMGTCDMVP